MPFISRLQSTLFRGRHAILWAVSCWLAYREASLSLHYAARCCEIIVHPVQASLVAFTNDSRDGVSPHKSLSKHGIPAKSQTRITPRDDALLFHLIFTTDVDKFTTLNLRTIESIFFHHPKATVIIHWSSKYFRLFDNTPPLAPLQQLQDLGYDLTVRPYTTAEILKETLQYTDDTVVNRTLAEDWMSQIHTKWVHEEFWDNNESNLVRVCLLFLQGGIYLDTDAVLTQPLDTAAFPDNSMAVNEKDHLVANFVMKFLHPGNKFLQANLADFFANYNGRKFGHNGVKSFGRTIQANPDLICPHLPAGMRWPTRRQSPDATEPCWFQPLPRRMFTAVPYNAWDYVCFDDDSSSSSHDDEEFQALRDNPLATLQDPAVYVIHLNNYVTNKLFARQAYVKDSLCDLTFRKYCIVCTEV